MREILISIKPKWCELIANGKKTVEVRKTKPRLTTPFKVYIYCTKDKERSFFPPLKKPIFKPMNYVEDVRGNGKVIGEFVCDKIYRISHCGTCNKDIRLRIVDENLFLKELNNAYLDKCQLSYSDIKEYSNGSSVYGWNISNVVIYDIPKELSSFFVSGTQTFDCPPLVKLKRAPQSWCYVGGGADE